MTIEQRIDRLEERLDKLNWHTHHALNVFPEFPAYAPEPAISLDTERAIVEQFINEWCVLTIGTITPDGEIYVTRDHDLWTNFCIWRGLRGIVRNFPRLTFMQILCERGLELKAFFWYGIGMPFRKAMAL